MTEFTFEFVLFIVCVGCFTAAAALWDIRSRRIPNALTVPVFVAGLFYQMAFNGFAGLGNAAQAFALGFGTFFILWMIGGGGGGDVKLVGALAVWLGLRLTLLVLIVSTVFVVLGTVALTIWAVATRGIGSLRMNSETASGRAASVQEKSPTPQKPERRIMAFALPVTLATWVIVLLKLDEFPFVN